MIDIQNRNNFVDIHYAQTGKSSNVDQLGMREMQAKAYEHRDQRFLLIKAPPASGKSRALMFIALDKLAHQGIKKVVVAVPERSIGRSFQSTSLKKFGFFADWKVAPYFNLCSAGGNESDKAGRFCEFMHGPKGQILLCTHATLRNAMKQLEDTDWNHCLLAIDEFHHTSADANSELGDTVRRVMNHSTGHIVAMTGSYFRGDGIPVLRAEDEVRFYPVTYNYYQQLNGYKYLKNLVLSYHFYKGVYLDHLMEVLDTHRKTIIHIPSVQSRASTAQGKYAEAAEIRRLIGEEVWHDYNTGIYTLRTSDGRLLKVADLVEDNVKTRNRVYAYLDKIKQADDLDIIIALGTAKEGFDWEWCDTCLTIGVRGSLTEVVQIIGRCTRDCKGKDTARFINMIAMPDADQPDVKVAVNDFLKAITASLLMEQVMAPSWHFKTAKEEIADDDFARTIVVEGLKPLSSAKTRQIVDEQLDDLKASILQDDMVVKAISGSTTAEAITQYLIPKVIREKYPDLSQGEVEEVRQRVLLDTVVKGNDIVDEKGNPVDLSEIPEGQESQESEGNRLLKLTNRFINIDQLNINLIDTINPFQRAYEVLSKTVDAPTLKIIQDTIAEQKFDMPIDMAIKLFKGPLKRWVAEHGGQKPSMNDPNPQTRELAFALQKIKNLKIRKMMGLEYEPDKDE
ncbi:MAG: DEAD/DEAH box helicase family protein [Prevotella sp.]|jgi:superfamily II DNA or RNA helicase|nr:DEAD/DEAH box helicase family protein [Prevotella sp.]MCH4100763.1 DEAD/DEAH box helicase family protein [Prevotella sp.]MCI1323985.1 DEAD/DEAH box helicase family protein [Prevotella sp.]MCI1348643.1 DEAD/DEAH box helicase family protein [Prevotella sp.]